MNFLKTANNKITKQAAIAIALFLLPHLFFGQENFSVEKKEIPEGEWQAQLSFPDRQGQVDDSLTLNSLYSFEFFEGQGELFIEIGKSVKSFSMFINQESLDTSALKSGNSYKIDFSKISRNGKNSLQLSSIRAQNKNDGIKVYVPYPILIPGKIQDAFFDQDSIDLISEIIQSDIERGFPCAQIAISQNGKLLYKNSWGYANSYDQEENPIPVEERKKITNKSLFDLASCSKALATNYALEYLISNKKLALDDKVADILGSEFYRKTINIKYKRGSGVSLSKNKKWKSQITIRDLACHRAGFPAGPAYYNKNFNSQTQCREKENQTPKNKLYAGSGTDEKTRKKTYEAVCKTPLLYEPGTRVLYSDADYIILCFVVEKITNERLDEFCKKIFWEPLELKRTTFNPLENGFSKDDCAATEIRGNTRGGTCVDFAGREETIQGQVHDETAWYSMAGISGHAGLFSTAEETTKLLFASLTGGYGQHRFFSKDVLDAFMAPQSDQRSNWGIGWYRAGDDRRSWNFSQSVSRRTFGHNGWTGTFIMVEPEEKITLAYFTSKRNTPYRDDNTYNFEGSYYTAANYGFIPQLLFEGGIKGSDKKRARLLLLEDMVHDKFRLVDSEKTKDLPVFDKSHPIVQAAYSILEVFVRRAKAYGTEEALALARGTIKYLSPLRDAEEIAKIKEMLK
ncbi:MAG: serine hydrolase [Treponema sp.]|nr:serine hydrolase [Treponema sp.]